MSRSVSRAVVVKSLNVCIDVIITLPKALMPLTAAPVQYRQLDPSVNLPESKSRAVFAPSELSSDLLVIYLSSDCILMLPNRSNREYPLFGVSTRKAFITLRAAA